jgi:CTP:molybdopterin cytidylyltransferase MocA
VTGGLVLAAGQGTRFGAEPKLLAPFRGRPLLAWAVSAQLAAPGLDRVVVVLGAHAEQVRAAVDLTGAEVIVCTDWLTGQSASLRAGVAALGGCARVLVTLGDQPLITPAAIARVLAAGPGPVRAAYAGRPGHPVVLSGPPLAAVLGLRGDAGARALLAGARLVECADVAGDQDIDTPEDLSGLSRLSGSSTTR